MDRRIDCYRLRYYGSTDRLLPPEILISGAWVSSWILVAPRHISRCRATAMHKTNKSVAAWYGWAGALGQKIGGYDKVLSNGSERYETVWWSRHQFQAQGEFRKPGKGFVLDRRDTWRRGMYLWQECHISHIDIRTRNRFLVNLRLARIWDLSLTLIALQVSLLHDHILCVSSISDLYDRCML